jgi:NADH dehydrogenase FAD-containing subunit
MKAKGVKGSFKIFTRTQLAAMVKLHSFFGALTALSVTSLVSAANVVTNDPQAVSNKTYDFIVVGGGLAGITVAARLVEVSSNTVLVIEAGRDDRGDSRVYDIYA